MHPTASHFERFVRAVQRRMVATRLSEAGGLGFAAGCAVALAVVLIGAWRGRPVPWVLTAALAGGGLVVGALLGWLRRPTRLAAALAADDQLRLNDLLGSALRFSPALVRTASPADPFGAQVLAQADERCGQLSPSSVATRRLGPRVWAGVVLVAAALALTGTLVSGARGSAGGEPRERTRLASRASHDDLLDRPMVDLVIDASPDGGRRRPRPEGGDDSPRPGDAGARQKARNDQGPEGDSDASDSDQTTMTSADADGGDGAGSTDERGETPDPERASGTDAEAEGGTGDAEGTGAGRASDKAGEDAHEGAADSGTATGGAREAAPVPPWRAEGWPDAVDDANAALATGDVPDAYRDLVRHYFDRGEPEAGRVRP